MSSTSVPKDHYYVNPSSIGKSRRNSPGDSQGIPPYYQTPGQGLSFMSSNAELTISNSSSFVTGPAYSSATFTQPRSSPGRFDISAQALYSNPQWTGNSPQLEQSFSPNYDMMPSGRYSPAPSHSYGYSTRGSSPPSMIPQDRQRLPPLTTSSSGDRWHQSTSGYEVSGMNGYSNPNHVASIRSPNPSYATSYTTYPSGSHGDPYYMQGHDPLAVNVQGQPGIFDDMRGMQPRPTSPGYRGHPSMNSYATPPPVSPTSPEETTVKKKRKRADAHQLKVLNETYARTAFPSTEERHALAKALDMSARSVQIWFQNKRQSMRQTNRQANTSSSSHPAYGPTSIQSERHMEDGMGHGQVHPPGFSNGQLSLEAPYLAQDIPRSHTSQSTSRRYRSPEDESHKQWRGY